MPKTKKGKGSSRLDKWYHIAKEQGYRSRAAFKLIQLNRKYNFLNNANTLVDLCAAPGGWLQVATRYMPVSSIKIGIDLDSIKHVPGCITYQEDITTPKCLALIKKEIRNEKVDVVLNDGAPNVGANWRKDAFAQVELVLAALKLAATVLRRGGTFVTKVFRSADYNSLIWVLNKFFEKVEATKPAASRTQSAEIFIVCMRFLAPDYTDPKLFDARFVFKDTEQDLLDASNQDFISLDKLLKPRRHREGYEDDAGVALFKSMSLGEFVQSENPLTVFAKYNKIIITPTDQEKYMPLVPPPEDYKEIIEDLRVQGKRELQVLLKWRSKIVRALGKQKKKEDKDAMVPEGEEEKDGDEAAGRLEDDLEKEKRRELKILRKEKENKLKKAIKLKSQAPGTVENDEETEFDWTKKRNFEKLGYVDLDDEDDDFEPVIEKKRKKDEREVEENIELLYDLKKKSIANEERRRIARAEEKRKRKFGEEENEDENEYQLETIEAKNYGNQITEERQPSKRDIDIEDDSDDDEDYEDLEDDQENVDNIKTVTQNALERSKWFDRAIFKQGIDSENPEGLATITNPLKLGTTKSHKKNKEELENPLKTTSREDEDGFEDIEDEEEKADKNKKDKLKIKSSMKGAEKRRQKIRQDSFLNDIDHMNAENNDAIEVVPALRYEDYDVDDLAQVRALARKMLRKKDREDIMEDSYNRYTRHVDEDAPDWFREDENRHNYKIMPITKEEYAAEKQKLLEWKNRPIKKIAEAKIRKKFQVQKKLRKASDKAKDIMEQEGVTEASKLRQVQNIYKKAVASKKVEKKYIVSKGFKDKGKRSNRKVGRNTRMVDSRLKKDKRAQKRIEKRKGGPRAGGPKKSKKRQISRR